MPAESTFRAALNGLLAGDDPAVVHHSIEQAWVAVLESVDALLERQGVAVDPKDPHAANERRLRLQALGHDDLWDRMFALSQMGAELVAVKEPLAPEVTARYFIEAATCVERASGTEGLVGETFRVLSEERV